MKRNLTLRIRIHYTGPVRCASCQRQDCGVAFQLEQWIPFGEATPHMTQDMDTALCWQHFQAALSNSDFDLEIYRSIRKETGSKEGPATTTEARRLQASHCA